MGAICDCPAQSEKLSKSAKVWRLAVFIVGSHCEVGPVHVGAVGRISYEYDESGYVRGSW
jgi:hypothetical protein